MRTKLLLITLALVYGIAFDAFAQAPTPEQLNELKSLPQEQQDALLQGLSTKSDNANTKTDPKLKMPQTVQRKDASDDQTVKYKKGKTADGRTLRQVDEDPELQPDDSVLIDLTPYEMQNKKSGGNDNNNTNQLNALAPNGTLPATGNLNNTDNNNNSNNNGANQPREGATASGDYGRIRPDMEPKTDEEKKVTEDFRLQILRNNPYRLNKFGVLEVPGLPSIPLAGLTADEATKRLSADPGLRDFIVKLTLLRLRPFDQEALKPFGYDLFEGEPSTFAPVSDIQVPMDYVVGAGDTLNLQLYGNESANYTLTVERDGRINFPKLGPIEVAGLTFDSVRDLIEHRVQQQLIGARVSVTMGELRSIRVFVLGDVEKPGSYAVSGLSTMTNALFVSGGVKTTGSLRNIELKRNGRLVTVLDLYDLLLHGDTSGDRHLMPGDVIFIPPIGRTVSVYGAVRRPAIYELKAEKSAAQLIEIAGGLLPDADGKTVQLEHIDPFRVREMVNIDLSSPQSRTAEIGNGDSLRVPAIRPTVENSVTLKGYVFRPGSFEYHPGLRLTDIIGSYSELRPNADRHYVMIRREVPPTLRVEVVSADLERALDARGSPADILLKPRDQIFVFNLSANRDRVIDPVLNDLELQGRPDKPAQIVSVDGKVRAPGRYPLEPAMHVSDLIRAGGSLEDSAYTGAAELTRYEVVNGTARQTDLIPVDLAAIRRGDASADLLLKPYDSLLIKIIPQWEEPGTIELMGEVRFPGKYPIHRGETLATALQRAGGLTDLAFGEGAVFIREELKKREKDQVELLATRLQSDLAALSLEVVASSAATANSNGAASASQALIVGQQLLTQLHDAKPVGRLVIDINRVMKAGVGGSEDVVLRNGDRLLVPKQSQEITILGEVQSPTSHIFKPGLTRDDYIAKSGGATQKADRKRIYVVRANGDVVTGERGGWFRRSQSITMRPGDTIVVPLDTERVNSLPIYQAVTTIIYNLAVALLAVRSV
jgi:protein involved in polysaccharide export with SLBB domain